MVQEFCVYYLMVISTKTLWGRSNNNDNYNYGDNMMMLIMMKLEVDFFIIGFSDRI